MPQDDSDFQTVLAAARLGEEWAWTYVYQEYSPAVLRYLRGHGAREADDLLGEVFVQVVRNVGSFTGAERDFRAWVFMIARNRLVDEWRRNGRTSADPVPHEVLLAHAGAGNAEDDALRRLGNADVLRILDQLTADQRDVLYLRFFAQLTVDEVAQVMGKRSGAIKQLQARGLAAIRREMLKGAVTL